ncbi:MAG TPA: hypothetical protein VGC37_01655 [Friedmanniella sp.]
MTKASRIRRGLTGVLGLVLAGSVTAAAGAGPAAGAPPAAIPSPAANVGPAANAGDHLTNEVLLSARDLARAGWDDPQSYKPITPEGLLAQCGIEMPFWAPGFRELKRRAFAMSPPYRSGAQLVIAFDTAADARDYEDNYGFGVGVVCADIYGEKRWDLRSSAPLSLRDAAEHAHTWEVRDTTGRSQTLSITFVRVHERVEVLWLMGQGHDDPARSIDLHQVVQRAADRMVA